MQPEDFDLVLTDSQMPGLSGTDLAQVLLRIRPGVRILLSTGFAGRVTSEAARAIGLQGLLLKPATMGALACAVKSALAPTDPHSR